MTDKKYVTINLSPEMFATLTGLTGLAVSVMKDDRENAQEFATMLSDPTTEQTAKEIIELLQSITRDIVNGPAETITPKIQIVS